jgi:hypothetical protein
MTSDTNQNATAATERARDEQLYVDQAYADTRTSDYDELDRRLIDTFPASDAIARYA